MRERIFLTYTNASALPYHGAVLGHHVVLNYIDSNGVHHTLEGGQNVSSIAMPKNFLHILARNGGQMV
jgi:hypothetical protein